MESSDSSYRSMHSDSDSDYSASSSDASSDPAASFSSVQADLERMSDCLRGFTVDLDTLGEQLTILQKPVEHLQISQLHDVGSLAESAFRNEAFQLKPPGFPGIDMTRRYPFHEICAILRTYLFQTAAVQPDGSICVNAALKQLFQLEDDVVAVTYLDLLASLKNLLV